MKKDLTIFGVSTRIGSEFEIRSALEKAMKDGFIDEITLESINIVSQSTYHAATKALEEEVEGSEEKIEYRTRVSTREKKKKVYLGGNVSDDPKLLAYQEILKNQDVDADILDSAIKAEIKNANTFVHAQLAMYKEVLKDILNPDITDREYFYRPEEDGGALTLEGCVVMAQAEEDINKVIKACWGEYEKVNLAKLLYDDLYEVDCDDEMRKQIDNYFDLTIDEKGKLLHRWFVGRQKRPDKDPHLEGVKLQKISRDKESDPYTLPRIPREDYEGIVLLCKLAEKKGVEVDTLKTLVKTFEESFEEAKENLKNKGEIDYSLIAANEKMDKLAKDIQPDRP
jgi:hypothetical protein